jgi:uncharacterized protein involved in type VI secretion and phage assembly
MPISIYDSGEKKEKQKSTSIVIGTVINNLDCIAQGKVQVRLHSLAQEVWARLASPGAGPNSGFFHVPRVDDEVLVALNDADPTDAFIIGGLWNTKDRTPQDSPPEALVNRIIRTGVTSALGHEMKFDDALQSITIKSSSDQKVTIDPVKIELANMAGTLKISMDNKTQMITISAANGIELSAKASIKLKAALVEIESDVATSVKSKGAVSVNGKVVKLN